MMVIWESFLPHCNNVFVVFELTCSLTSGFQVFNTGVIYDHAKNTESVNDMVKSILPVAQVLTGNPPCHISVSPDNLTLSVVALKSNFPFALMYDIRAFAQKVCPVVYSLIWPIQMCYKLYELWTCLLFLYWFSRSFKTLIVMFLRRCAVMTQWLGSTDCVISELYYAMTWALRNFLHGEVSLRQKQCLCIVFWHKIAKFNKQCNSISLKWP